MNTMIEEIACPHCGNTFSLDEYYLHIHITAPCKQEIEI